LVDKRQLFDDLRNREPPTTEELNIKDEVNEAIEIKEGLESIEKEGIDIPEKELTDEEFTQQQFIKDQEEFKKKKKSEAPTRSKLQNLGYTIDRFGEKGSDLFDKLKFNEDGSINRGDLDILTKMPTTTEEEDTILKDLADELDIINKKPISLTSSRETELITNIRKVSGFENFLSTDANITSITDTTPQKITPQKITPQKITPQKITPQKITPPTLRLPKETIKRVLMTPEEEATKPLIPNQIIPKPKPKPKPTPITKEALEARGIQIDGDPEEGFVKLEDPLEVESPEDIGIKTDPFKGKGRTITEKDESPSKLALGAGAGVGLAVGAGATAVAIGESQSLKTAGSNLKDAIDKSKKLGEGIKGVVKKIDDVKTGITDTKDKIKDVVKTLSDDGKKQDERGKLEDERDKKQQDQLVKEMEDLKKDINDLDTAHDEKDKAITIVNNPSTSVSQNNASRRDMNDKEVNIKDLEGAITNKSNRLLGNMNQFKNAQDRKLAKVEGIKRAEDSKDKQQADAIKRGSVQAMKPMNLNINLKNVNTPDSSQNKTITTSQNDDSVITTSGKNNKVVKTIQPLDDPRIIKSKSKEPEPTNNKDQRLGQFKNIVPDKQRSFRVV
jgi:hypothetical protein